MSFFELANLRAVTAGRWISRPEDAAEIHGFGIDTREDLTAKAFIAIEGETHDGHGFLDDAIRAGAGMLIVGPSKVAGDRNFEVPVLEVEQTRRALGKLAAAYRRTLVGTRVVAVTGSSGKTTTKRMIDAVLGQTLRGRAAIRSFNNDIGVPLTLLSASPRDQYLVVEIGANAPGEIAQLARLAEPDIAVITNVGRSHLEGFGSIEDVAREKASLLNHVADGGLSVIFADSQLLREHARIASTTVSFGETDQADIRLLERGYENELWWFEINDRSRFSMRLAGRHNAFNALAAIAVARRFGIDDGTINAGLQSLEPEAMRMTPQHYGSILVINDAYNANPESMIAAVDTFVEMTAQAERRVLILGDMLELGAQSAELHASLGRYIHQIDGQCRIHAIIAVGEAMRSLADVLTAQGRSDIDLVYIDRFDEDVLARAVENTVLPNDTVLIKASRGMGIEQVIPHIEKRSLCAPSESGVMAAGPARVAGP